MTDPSTPVTPGPVQFHREFVTGPNYVRTLASASIRRSLLTPSRLIRTIAVFVVFVAVLVAISITPTLDAVVPITIVSVCLVFIVLVGPLSYLYAVRRLRIQLPPGSKYSIGFRDDALLIGSPLANTEVSFRAYEKVDEYRGFVYIKQRMSRLNTVLPAELFTTESMAFLRSRVTTRVQPSPPATPSAS